MMETFEKILLSLLENVNCVKKNEALVEEKQALVKGNVNVVVKAKEVIEGLMAQINQKRQELTATRKRATEICSRMAELLKEMTVLSVELELVTKREKELNQVIAPTQIEVHKMTMDVVDVSTATSKIEVEIVASIVN